MYDLPLSTIGSAVHTADLGAVSSRVTAPVNGSNQGAGAPGALLQLMCPCSISKGTLREGWGNREQILVRAFALILVAGHHTVLELRKWFPSDNREKFLCIFVI